MKVCSCVLFGLLLLMAASPTWAVDIRHTKKNMGACFNEEDLDKLLAYITQKDEVAIDKLIERQQCFALKPGIPVFIMKTNNGKVEVRPKGKTWTFWTIKEAIE